MSDVEAGTEAGTEATAGTATRNSAAQPGAIVRPSPMRWLAYTYGAALPSAHRGWVFRDVTGPTWIVRHFLRATLYMAPIIVAAGVLLPLPAVIKVAALVGSATLGYIFSAAYIVEATERRMEQAGFPAGLAERTRLTRAEAKRAATTAKLRAKREGRARK